MSFAPAFLGLSPGAFFREFAVAIFNGYSKMHGQNVQKCL